MRMRGFSLVEMLMVLVIAGIALAIAVPNLQDQIVSARTRAVAESIKQGLQLARSEAIKRNAMMRFQMVSTMDSSCAASAASHLWVVTQFTSATTPSNTRGVPWGQCNVNGYTPPDQEEPCPTSPAYTGNATTCVSDPFIAYKSATDSAPSVTVAATPAATGAVSGLIVTYGPMGQLMPNFDGSTTVAAATPTINVTPSAGVSGRSYRVEVRANGGIKLCVPSLPSSDPMGC